MTSDPIEGIAEHTGSCIGLSAIVHALVLAASAMAAPALTLGHEDSPAVDTALLIQQYLVAAAERESDIDLTPTETGMGAPGPATRCGVKAGRKMGLPMATQDGRYGVQGPADNEEPHIASRAGPDESGDPGLIGAIAREQAKTLIAPWGRDSALGTDPVHAQGYIWGDQIAAASGQSGLGPGGGCSDACGGAGGVIRLSHVRDPASGDALALASAEDMRTQRSW